MRNWIDWSVLSAELDRRELEEGCTGNPSYTGGPISSAIPERRARIYRGFVSFLKRERSYSMGWLCRGDFPRKSSSGCNLL